jgi:hypothetical protein
VFHAWKTFIDKEENFTWEYFLSSPLWLNKTIKIENKPVFYEDWFRKGICFVHLHSVRNSFLTQVVFRAKINKFRLIIFNPPSQKSFCNNSLLTLCTGELHIKVKISSFTFFKMSWVELGNVMIRWFKTGKIRVFTTVIFPLTVRFLFDHIFISFFIFKETYPGVKHPSSYWVLILMLIWIKL